MLIRNYKNDDFKDVCDILIEAFPSVASEFKDKEICSDLLDLDRDNYFQVVAEVDNRVVGYLLATKNIDPILKRNNFLIDYVCVDSNYRGRGIGRELLKKTEEIARRENVFYLQLTSSRFRAHARKLYMDFGFEIRESDIFRKVLR